MRILVDVDSTVADMLPEWLRRYNRDFDDNVKEKDITAWELSQFLKPECGSKIFSYLSDPDLYDNVKPYDGALFVIKELRKRGHQILFASAGISGAYAKYNWLRKWSFITTSVNPESEYIAIYHKNLLDANLLIDDRDKNALEFVERKRKAILMDRPWNLAAKIQPSEYFRRANSWQKVMNLIDLLELSRDYWE